MGIKTGSKTWVISLFVLAGCSPKVEEGHFLCDPHRPQETCPEDWACRLDPSKGQAYCYETAPLVCGDGVADTITGATGRPEVREDCDGEIFRTAECTSLPDPSNTNGDTFAGGLLECSAKCTIQTFFCLSNICGNGIREGAEECDGGDIPSNDVCHGDGSPTCGPDCRLDRSSCGTPPACGNGRIDADEDCDGTDLAGATCESLGFAGGTLACLSNCRFDFLGCIPTLCGNGRAEEGLTPVEREMCDGTDFGRFADPDGGFPSCRAFGLPSGQVACTSECRLDLSACEKLPSCGNHIREGQEMCDGSDLAGRHCEDFGLPGDGLSCHPNCTFDWSGCR